MYLENIRILNFKNYEGLNSSFCEGINCFVGENGAGKTNLLDAIYYISVTKSAFSTLESQNINHNSSYFSITAHMAKKNKTNKVQCSLLPRSKKKVLVDGKEVEKISEYIGKFPAVMIAPDDTELIMGGSEGRRKFFDSLISQLSPEYLNGLILYNRQLKQKNALLKNMAENGTYDTSMLDIYDSYLIQAGATLHQKRKEALSSFLPIFKMHYTNISNGKEDVGIDYNSDFDTEDIKAVFHNARGKDLALQRCTIGIHKDDFNLDLGGYPLKKYGSQGQKKSFLIALKLAYFDMLKEHNDDMPILLLDDIFDKLDDSRIQKLIQMIGEGHFGQIFITDARPERTKHFLSGLDKELRIYEIKGNGIVLNSNMTGIF